MAKAPQSQNLALAQPGWGHEGRWRNLDVAVKVVVFCERGGGEHTSTDRAIMEVAVAKSCVHPNVVSEGGLRLCACVGRIHSRVHALQRGPCSQEQLKHASGLYSPGLCASDAEGKAPGHHAVLLVPKRWWRLNSYRLFEEKSENESCALSCSSVFARRLRPLLTYLGLVCTYNYDITPVTVHPVGAPNLHVEQSVMGPSEYKLYLIQVRAGLSSVAVVGVVAAGWTTWPDKLNLWLWRHG
eukprot:105602-Pelagomonas_calceolata.AAC.4